MSTARGTGFAAALGALMGLGAWWGAVPAPITIDDVSYVLMARDLAAGHGLEIWNGYEERASPELELIVPGNASQISAHGGRLVSQYPEGYAALAALPYKLWGERGLFGLSALGGAITIALTAVLARRRGASGGEALGAAALLAVASFMMDYMLGVPPHTVVSAMGLGAWILLDHSLDKSRFLTALGAGLLLGAALTVRLDALALVGALGLLVCMDPRAGGRQAGGLALGLLPALGLLSWTNLLKFGTPSPLSYGNAVAHTSGPAAYLPALLVAAPVALALVALGRPSFGAALSSRLGRRWGLALGLTFGVGLLLLPPAREALLALGRGSWALWGDLRDIPPVGVEPTDTLTPGRAMLHWGSLKKALAQSAPWLGLLPLWLLEAARRDSRGAWRREALLVPLLITLLTGLRAYHGGGSLSMRYFVPALPFLSLLAAASLAELARALPPGRAGLLAALGLGLGLGVPVFFAPEPDAVLALAERFWLDLPLALAGAVAAAGVGVGLLEALGRPRRALAGVALALTMAGVGWGAAVTWSYDVPRRLEVRTRDLHMGRAIAAALPQGGVVFGALAEHIGLAADLPQTRLALAPLDDGADLVALAQLQLGEGRGAVALFSDRAWTYLERSGRLVGLETTLLWSSEPYQLRRLSLPSPSSPTSPPPPDEGG